MGHSPHKASRGRLIDTQAQHTDDFLLVFTTMPDHATAENLAEHLVSEKLAACVNIGAKITSVYRWDGDLHKGEEYPLTIKTRRQHYARLEQEIRDMHPYELPEIMAVSPTAALPDYLNWISTCTND